MDAYILKKGVESFQITSGPNAGRKFVRGKKYKESEIPAEVRDRFAMAKSKESAKRKAQSAESKAKSIK